MPNNDIFKQIWRTAIAKLERDRLARIEKLQLQIADGKHNVKLLENELKEMDKK